MLSLSLGLLAPAFADDPPPSDPPAEAPPAVTVEPTSKSPIVVEPPPPPPPPPRDLEFDLDTDVVHVFLDEFVHRQRLHLTRARRRDDELRLDRILSVVARFREELPGGSRIVAQVRCRTSEPGMAGIDHASCRRRQAARVVGPYAFRLPGALGLTDQPGCTQVWRVRPRRTRLPFRKVADLSRHSLKNKPRVAGGIWRTRASS